jgi:HAD superfamily hydrolase (TIGR01490 family)
MTETEPSVSASPGIAAFDLDGTLVRGDTFIPFLGKVVGAAKLARIGARYGHEMVSAYRKMGRDGAKAVVLSRSLAGRPETEVREAGEKYGTHLLDRVRPYMRERLDWHAAQGHRRILVSASLAIYLEPFGRAAGFDAVIATALEVGDDGLLTGRMAGANVRGAEKASRLQALIEADSDIWAYGNSAGDVELLALARYPVWVRRGRRRPTFPPV